MKRAYQNLVQLLVRADTVSVRFWFAIASISASLNHYTANHGSVATAMAALAPHGVWLSLFLLHGCALLYGVLTHKFGKTLLFLEGILGTALWVAAAFAVIQTKGMPDATLAGALIALWLLIRYPTHWEYTDGGK